VAAPPADRGASRRGFAVVAGGGVVLAALAALASAKPWVDVHAALDSAVQSPVVASTLQPYAQSAVAPALALVALASWGVLLVVRGRARTAMAVVGAVFALALLVTVALGYGQVPDAVRGNLAGQFGLGPRAAGQVPLPHTGWYWLALLSAAGSVLALVVAVRRARTWPAMGTRYDAPAAARTSDSAQEKDMWRSLDEGDDPTDPGSA
jgi:uncharacterized membrane protein (TIGR02234 family)